MSDVDTMAANTIRVLSAAMVEKANSGHPGGAMGAADYIHILFSEFMVDDPENPEWPFRDRFFLDAGHMSPMLYSILTLSGRMDIEQLKNFRQWESHTPGHPEIDHAHGIENTSGPLGQGHTYGVGAAIAERFLKERFGDWTSHMTYLFISDGGVQEEISQGAGRIAGYLGLGNIVMFYDSNDIQLSTETNAVTHEDTAKKYEAWGWQVQTINGNDQDEIRAALRAAQADKTKPSLIIGKTIMGKGALTDGGESFERKVSTHGMPLSGAGASYSKTIENLGGNSENPFVIPQEVQQLYAQSANRKRSEVEKRKKAEAEFRASSPEKAAKLDNFLNGQIPELDWSAIAAGQKPGSATRASSAYVLGVFAENIENMIVMSADLANSDKTDGFLKKTTPLTSTDFSGQFLHIGVSELTMAAVAVGMSIHGGIIPVCGTFFAFSDYMKPVLRMAALQKQPVKFLWTHDAFRVGEDGPTHQPIEQEAQLRLLEKLRNHDDQPSFLVLRPADSTETTMAWKLALENSSTPTGLILTRQDIIEVSDSDKVVDMSKGAYIIHEPEAAPELIVIANGSEVGTALQAIELLPEKNIRLVSVPSEGLFREQSEDYQNMILPDGVARAGITAGLGVNLLGLVGNLKRIHSLDHFGYSASYKVLDEEFGFTPAQFAEKLKTWL
jgi:transketolase